MLIIYHVVVLHTDLQGRSDSDVIALRKILTQKENGSERIKKGGKTAIKQLEEIAKAQNLGEFVKKNVKRQQEYANLILFQVNLKDGN